MERADGRRKSNFPAVSSLPADSTLDFVSAGVNYKIPLANFLLSLGVTGSIVQVGSPTGTPVLDTQGTVRGIRNLETDDDSGLAFNVSAENGIYAKLDAQPAAGTGIAVLDSNNKIRHLKAGTGIAIAVSGDDIVVTYTGAVASQLTTGVTAFGGGGQLNAVVLTTAYTQVSAVGATGDSLKLPLGVAELSRTIINNGANALDVFPGVGGKINGLAANTAVPVAPNGTLTLYCYDTTNWVQI